MSKEYEKPIVAVVSFQTEEDIADQTELGTGSNTEFEEEEF